ncbi:hypothetical protein FISHEDRAFT_56016 [Fistulina hepatica ATCC 64428]|uniref:Uncharacterized protein n=1 Tax=Fistulina hepatica ATCC 64428 TaxID=1128425 RepID=A0A0D7AK84_9AGAR|nr:hypothetical protein FISHEDRAFT_56016 [Fistulina hepatica ATCC 64428]
MPDQHPTTSYDSVQAQMYSSGEEEWEDIDSSKKAEANSPRGVLRRRKTIPTRVFKLKSRKRRARSPVITREEAIIGMVKGARFTARYILQVVGQAIGMLRRPLAFLLFLWIFAFIAFRVSLIIRATLRPLCYFPGISGTSFCAPQMTMEHADFPSMIDKQTTTFESLLDTMAGGPAPALDMIKAQVATQDLVTAVRESSLFNSDDLADRLVRFAYDARSVGARLSLFGSRIGGAVDQLINFIEHARDSIQAARGSQSLWVPWSSQPNGEIVVTRFREMMDFVSERLRQLIRQAEEDIVSIDALDQQLREIHDIARREDGALTEEKEAVLADLWTFLGGNRHRLRSFDRRASLLKELGTYRKAALVQITSALYTLRTLSSDMEVIRERATTQLSESPIPIEVHIKSIQMGLNRLTDSRVRARDRENEIITRHINSRIED